VIISKKYARRLIANGKAREAGIIRDGDQSYMSLDRLDILRVDHYRLDVKK
jgi:hypothetical protein